jgi:ubiquinone/menaquinone biosynthesis C-methylase UbiE
MSSHINFGYPWFLSHGHLLITAIALTLWFLGRGLKWRQTPMVVIGVVLVWSVAAFLEDRFVLNLNGRASMPTEKFLASGAGRVLDMGAGTGRSSLMVLEARPQTTLVALDLFGESYKQHFGAEQSGQERLLSNLRIAGVDKRATIQVGDMRQIPFEAATFDSIVSAYAIDHLNRAGVTASLSEASRVLKPGGEFLMMVIANDAWVMFGYGPLMMHGMHGGLRTPEDWTTYLQAAGFQMVEQGTRPATLYFLARKP